MNISVFGKLLLCGTLFAYSHCVNANDSVARVGIGGLELVKTDNIQMVSEKLEISVKKIRVKYHFLNTSDTDIRTTVAFPMPAINGARRIIGGEENQRPLDSFQIRVNGKSVSVKKKRVFFVNGTDVTDKLQQIGLSEEQIFNPKFDCWLGDPRQGDCKMTDDQFKSIQEMKIRFDGQIQETAYWEQVFPAGKEIEVTHEYKPFVSSGANGYYADSKWGMESLRKRGAEACLDEQMYRALLRQRDKKTLESSEDSEGPKLPIYSQDVEYILGTGKNWQGPIKDFKLILNKTLPSEIVSLCFPGRPVKISPIAIMFSQTDYVPQDKLIVYFYR